MTDTEIVNTCRAILWPEGQWTRDAQANQWTPDHLEALASVLERPPLQGRQPSVGFQFENRLSITHPDEGGQGRENP